MSSARRMAVKALAWAKKAGLARRLALVLSLLVIPSVGATFYAMTVSGPEGPDPSSVLALLVLDVVLLLALGCVVGFRIVGVWRDRRRGAMGSRLHLRFISLFAIVAVTPSLLMSLGAALFFQYGLESWFSNRVRTALHGSIQVAQAYLEEHRQVIAGNALAMANDVNREGPTLFRSPQVLSSFISTQAAVRDLTEAIVFDGRGRVLGRSTLAYSIELGIGQIPVWAYERAKAGEVAVLTSENDQRVRALVMLPSFFGETYLFVGRFVDRKVLGHLEKTSAAAAEYERLEGKRSGLELAFSVVFAVVALLLLLSAVWVGLAMANRLATPIARLIDAAERVGEGELDVRVFEGERDEVGHLSRSFNRMTAQLGEQQGELVRANRELDERRRFTETVLAGVSAGVIGLDLDGNITLPNRSACEFLNVSAEEIVGLPLDGLLPELAEPLDEARRRPDRLVQAEVRMTRDGRSRTLLVRVAAEWLEDAGAEDEILGYVLTFDDISELVSAQRKAAWADVARRIAHEIKNPLTPIQLSAERLKRKYLKEIESDPDTYVKLVDTIVRQVGDIGRMVDEFSSFARMPAPQMKLDDLAEICRQTAFLQKTGYPDVAFVTELPKDPIVLSVDKHLVGQALTNVMKNAVEAVRGREGPNLEQGHVSLSMQRTATGVAVEVEDNGRGLPTENRDRLTEPYVTTRAKGTGLGLAIVKKIMEDHGGDLVLEDAPGGGARVRLIFPVTSPDVVATLADQTAYHGP